MKKLVLALIAGMFALTLGACGKADQGAADINAPVDALNTVWSSYADDQKFPCMGGDYANMVDGAPGACNVSDAEALKSLLVVPAEEAAMLDGAASMIHAMNANTFTAAAFHVSDAANAGAFSAKYADAVASNQWMCGFPEILIVAELGDGYVVTAFGNADMVDYFKGQLLAAYPSAKVTIEENLMA